MAHKINIDTKLLHPWLQYKLDLLLKELAEKKMWIIVTEGYRTVEQQNEKFKKGYSKVKGNDYGSQHQWYIAIDIAMDHDVDKDGKITDDTWNVKGFQEVAKIAKKLGFGWGGDWKSFVDRPHLYLHKWGSTPTKLKQKYGTPAKFKASFRRKVRKPAVMREGKLLTSKKLMTIPKGKVIDVLWYSKLGYAKVKYADKVGFIQRTNFS